MLDERRRQLLRQMNVDVWTLRATPGAEHAVAPGASSAGPAAALRAALETPPSVEPVAPAAAPHRKPAGSAPEPSAGASGTPAASLPASDTEPFAVVSVALPGVVLLLEGASSSRDMRLARDLVSAAAGDWSRKPERRRFVWPPPSGVAPGPGGPADSGSADPASRRALRAFAGKDLEDHAARLLICAGSVGERLPERWADVRVLRVPALSRLSRDAAAKRQLWAELSGLP